MSAATPRPPRWRRAYPDALLQAERERLLLRRAHLGRAVEPPPPELPADSTGLALSGGGIRSATFALGFFQGLGKARQLHHLDFLSTVSGGSYFGAVISSLLARPGGPSIEQVEDLLPESPPLNARPAANKDGRPAPWLRRNGYYLAPNGGDVLLAGSIWLRNWLALHLVIFIALVTGGLLLQLPWLVLGDSTHKLPLTAALQAGVSSGLVVSPWLDVLLLPLLLALAAGWAFWLLPGSAPPPAQPAMPGRLSERLREPHPVLGAVLAVLLAGAIALLSRYAQSPLLNWPWLPGAARALLLVALLSLVLRYWATRKAAPGDGAARNWLSRYLARCLGLAGLLLLVALTDSLGQSAYASLFVKESYWAGASAFAGLVLAALSRLLLLPKTAKAWLTEKLPEGQSLLSSLPQLSLQKLVPIIAALLALFWLSAAVTLSHAIARDFKDPWLVHPTRSPPAVAATAVAEPETESEPEPEPSKDSSDQPAPAKAVSATEVGAKTETKGKAPAAAPVCPLAPAETPACPPPAAARLAPPGPAQLWPWLCGLVLLGAFSLLFGHTWSFVNRSSYQALYAARLTRAYVGAGNPERTRERKPVTDPLPNDDVPLAQFASEDVQRRGGPLHLINVTVNETASANDGTVNRDRKGIGMSVGPCGFSAGVSHHALLLNAATELQALHRPASAQEREQNLTRYNMFGLAQGADEAAPSRLEALTLANWTAISGAAVAPGLGHHGGLGLSFLIAFANLRLGYWWRSGSDAYRATSVSRNARGLARQLRRLLPVHFYLGLEFAGRFPGADEPYWYLTDGGHFENLGLYELIRRRLPLVISVDAEADPDGGFESLVGLIGKARVDFGTDIEFLDETELKDSGLLLPGLVGPLDQLVTVTGDAPAPAKARLALARLKYPEGAPGWLLYLKAAYVGDEPRDLHAYRQQQPRFPHQTTGDQFFDETQWECYRKLGEHTAERLFGEGAPYAGFKPPQPKPRPPNAGSAGNSSSGDSPVADS